jgi:hypothetical protein
MESDAAYFSRRAQEERRAAQTAAHETARQLHLEMADRYDGLAAAIEGRQSGPAKLASAG